MKYDLVVDIPGNRSYDELKRVVADDGIYVLIGHDSFSTRGHRIFGSAMPRYLRLGLTAPFGRAGNRRARSVERRDPKEAIRELAAEGKLRPLLDRATYGLADVAAAMRHLEEGSLGRLVLDLTA